MPGFDLAGYEQYDKALDIYYLAIAYTSTLRNWADPTAFAIARFLFYYRLVGTLLFEFADSGWLLLAFPNTFEYVFLAYELIRTRWSPRRLSRRTLIALAAGIWIVIELPQEYWLHVAKLDLTNEVKLRLLGVDLHASWGAAVAHRPWVPVLALGVLAVLWAAWRHVRPRLPAEDWPFGFDVDKRAVGGRSPRCPRRSERGRARSSGARCWKRSHSCRWSVWSSRRSCRASGPAPPRSCSR